MIVWIMQTGEPLHCDTGSTRPMRAMNLANALVEKGHTVVLWSSAFYHQKKVHRTLQFESKPIGDSLTINLIPSPGYIRNIGLGRLFDHFVLARNLRSALLSYPGPLPSVMFVGFPPIEAAAVAVRWCKRNRVPSIIDVKDQWPSIFVDSLPTALRPIGRLAFFPYFQLARRALRDASVFSTMSKTFLDWMARFSRRPLSRFDSVFPLTGERPSVDERELAEARGWWLDKGVDLRTRRRFCFVGSVSPGFDFAGIQEAAATLLAQQVDCQIVICGDGPSLNTVKDSMKDLPNVIFPGWINPAQYVALSQSVSGTLAPYKLIDNFTQNIPNKIIDSLSFGLPILTSLHGEVGALIENNEIGVVCGGGSGVSWAEGMLTLLEGSARFEEMSRNSTSLYKREFEFGMVYGRLVDLLEEMAAKGV
jgi:glycosyltransferase involved in cell wall biosynthesis